MASKLSNLSAHRLSFPRLGNCGPLSLDPGENEVSDAQLAELSKLRSCRWLEERGALKGLLPKKAEPLADTTAAPPPRKGGRLK